MRFVGDRVGRVDYCLPRVPEGDVHRDRRAVQDRQSGQFGRVQLAGSSDLVTQLTQGASADVFASADTRNMDKAARAGLLAGNPVNFASNTLSSPCAGNPKNITSFADLNGPD